MIKPPNLTGLYTSNINYVKNYLVRDTINGPLPGVGSVPAWKTFGAQGPKVTWNCSSTPHIPNTSNPAWWHHRVSGINAVFNHNGQAHGFFHAEDLFNSSNVAYGFQGACGASNILNFRRIGYVRQDNIFHSEPYKFFSLGWSSAEPVIECFMDENTYQSYANEIGGTGTPTIIRKGDYLYMLYDRVLTRSYAQYLTSSGSNNMTLYTTTTLPGEGDASWGGRVYGQSICIARALYSDVVHANYATRPNPWLKYYSGFYSQPGYKGRSTPVIIPPASGRQLQMPHVSYNGEISKDILLVMGEFDPIKLYLYHTTSSNLSSWSSGILVDTSHLIASGRWMLHPTLIGPTGDDKASDRNNYLYYLDYDRFNSGNSEIRRTIFKIML